MTDTMEWISVKDRLPEEHTDVLCRVPSVINQYGSLMVTASYNKELLCWIDYMGNEMMNAVTLVTHWMPLPEPPNK